MAASDILRKMLNQAPQQVEDLDSSLSQIDALIDDLTEQIDAVTDGLCGVAESNLTTYLDSTKVDELELLYGSGLNTPFSVTYGADYGTIDYTDGGITDFTVFDSTGDIQYEYLGTNWDGDSYIVGLIDDYDFGNDYLTRPLTTGATYGLIPSRTSLSTGKSILEENKDKISDSIGALEDYAS